MGDNNPHFEGISRATTSDQVYARLRESIIDGSVTGGTILSQIDLAEQFGVSRVPVREALRRLQAEHLLIARPFQRYVVDSPTIEQALELNDIREILEVRAISRLADLDSVALLATLGRAHDIVDAMTAPQPYATWITLDREFHRVLNGVGSETARVVDEARMRIQQYLHAEPIQDTRRSNHIDDHRGVLDAIEAADWTTATVILTRHLQRTRRVIRDYGAMAASPPDHSTGRRLALARSAS